MLIILLGIILVFAILVGIYIAFAIFLNKFNLLVYKQKTALAWIPICNIYLLGKLTVNKTVGWILVVTSFLTTKYTVTINNISKVYTFLPTKLNYIVQGIYNVAVIGLLVYGIIKYNELKEKSKIEAISEQPVQATPPVQQAQPVQQTQSVQVAPPVQPFQQVQSSQTISTEQEEQTTDIL